jgi:hypothetical protein
MSGYRLMQAKKKSLVIKKTEPTAHWSSGYVIGFNPYVSISLFYKTNIFAKSMI